MIKWIWQLLFKAKRLSFKNGDIFVFKSSNKISQNTAHNIAQNIRPLLDKVGCKDSEIIVLDNNFDVIILNNNNQTKS
jgi:hypothetical protein